MLAPQIDCQNCRVGREGQFQEVVLPNGMLEAEAKAFSPSFDTSDGLLLPLIELLKVSLWTN